MLAYVQLGEHDVPDDLAVNFAYQRQLGNVRVASPQGIHQVMLVSIAVLGGCEGAPDHLAHRIVVGLSLCPYRHGDSSHHFVYRVLYHRECQAALRAAKEPQGVRILLSLRKRRHQRRAADDECEPNARPP